MPAEMVVIPFDSRQLSEAEEPIQIEHINPHRLNLLELELPRGHDVVFEEPANVNRTFHATVSSSGTKMRIGVDDVTVRGDCNEILKFPVLFTTLRAEGVDDIELRYRLKPRNCKCQDGDSQRVSTIDQCLLGNWQATDAGIQAMGEWLAANKLTRNNAMSEKEEITGSVFGSFKRNGSVTGEMRDFAQKYTTRMDMGQQQMVIRTTVITNDSTNARYSAVNGVLSIWNDCSQPTVRAISELNGKVMSDQLINMEKFSKMESISGPIKGKMGGMPTMSMAIPSEFEMRYTCNGNSLRVEHPAEEEEGWPPWHFTRVGTPRM